MVFLALPNLCRLISFEAAVVKLLHLLLTRPECEGTYCNHHFEPKRRFQPSTYGLFWIRLAIIRSMRLFKLYSCFIWH
ncbi:hypothetical protein CIPAW_04G094300 [Carya illinoinensis]|uniref:Secreted protein n=1 Tax=Carya illinoinensis TaxID=32201 RepID=A0A8T1QRD2_CARIL|nr:hypothetical protein CIPAW_04G094300 [Carya illinoinensis]KAG6657481.1 hypothetical protein CIPAW_04G094300 [Carya illinoinensis]